MIIVRDRDMCLSKPAFVISQSELFLFDATELFCCWAKVLLVYQDECIGHTTPILVKWSQTRAEGVITLNFNPLLDIFFF